MVSEISIESLSTAGSPRLLGENAAHVRTLAAAPDELPPIIVHRATMRVVDGRHRVRAARLRGRDTIAVRFFDGTEADAFVLAVQANVTHGLPLSLADRRRSAARIARTHPEWSDRRIATVTGLSLGTVAELRRRQARGPHAVRIGHAGRSRSRDRAKALAPGPVVARPPVTGPRAGHADGAQSATGAGDAPDAGGPETEVRPLPSCPDQSAAIVERLRADPALRLSPTGRHLLSLLDVATLRADEWEQIIANLPAHCSGIVVEVARACAGVWGEVAERTGRRASEAPASGPTERPDGVPSNCAS